MFPIIINRDGEAEVILNLSDAQSVMLALASAGHDAKLYEAMQLGVDGEEIELSVITVPAPKDSLKFKLLVTGACG